MLCLCIRTGVMLAQMRRCHAKQESNCTVRWKSKQTLKVSNQSYFSCVSENTHTQSHTHTLLIYAHENKGSANRQLLSIKCHFCPVIKSNFSEMFEFIIQSKQWFLCFICDTKQSWLRLCSPDKSKASRPITISNFRGPIVGLCRVFVLRQLCLWTRYLTGLSKIKTRTKAETTFWHRSAENNWTLVRRYHIEICFFKNYIWCAFQIEINPNKSFFWQHASASIRLFIFSRTHHRDF